MLKTYCFIINGDTVGRTNCFYSDPEEPFYVRTLTLTPKEHYTFAYKKRDSQGRIKCFLSIDGKDHGPFDSIRIFENDAFAYEENGKWFERIDDKVFGPYIGGTPNMHFFEANSFIYMTGDYAFYYFINNKIGINFNGKQDGPFDEMINYYYYPDGSYAFTYKDQNTYWGNINGKVLKCNNVYLNKEGDYTYTQLIDGKNILYLNGQKIGEYEGVKDIQIVDHHLSFCFLKDSQLYLYFDGKLYGAFESIYENLIAKGGYHLFIYKQNNKYYYQVNDKLIGVYNDYDVTYTNIDDHGNFYYVSKNDGKLYIDINGKDFGPYDEVSYDVDLKTNGSYCFSYTQNQHKYYISDGKKYDSFQLNDNNYYVSNENGNKYIVVKGAKWGPYDNIFDVYLTKDTLAFIYSRNSIFYKNENGLITSYPNPKEQYPVYFDKGNKVTLVYKPFYKLIICANKKELVYPYFNQNTDDNKYILKAKRFQTGDDSSEDSTFEDYCKENDIKINPDLMKSRNVILARYQENDQKYVWVAMENHQIVKYEYKVKE